jgi:3-hydroxyisobutyrate dehydrogenase
VTVIGVIGLGAMGRPIAAALAGAGADVRVFDVSEAAVQRAEAAGLRACATVAAVAAECDVVVLSLPTPAVVLDVVGQLAAGGRPLTVLDTSTVDPPTTPAAAALLEGGGYGDCPVLGRPEAVGRWTVPVGGDERVAAVAADVLAPVARRVVRVGEVGSAVAIKVLNNLMLGTINAITAEVLLLAEAAGVDPGTFVDVVVDSGAASVSGLFRDVAVRAVDGNFDPTFSLNLMHKDNRLALAMADSYGVPMVVGSATHTLNTLAVAAGHGEEDSIAVLKALEGISGHTARRHGGGEHDAEPGVGPR